MGLWMGREQKTLPEQRCKTMQDDTGGVGHSITSPGDRPPAMLLNSAPSPTAPQKSRRLCNRGSRAIVFLGKFSNRSLWHMYSRQHRSHQTAKTLIPTSHTYDLSSQQDKIITKFSFTLAEATHNKQTTYGHICGSMSSVECALEAKPKGNKH